MKSADRKLLLVFIFLSAALLFRVQYERTHFLSPDSRYYLQIAEHLISNQGFVMQHPDDKSVLIPVTIWPVGYPGLIAGFSWITGLSVLWASKLLNVVFLAGCLLLFRLVSKPYAWFLGMVFCTYTLLEVFSYTWSEVPFLFFLLLFSIALHRCSFTDAKPVWWLGLLLGSAGLFLSRYIGLFSVGVMGLAGMYFLWQKLPRKALFFLATAFAGGLLVLSYFYRNYLINGHLSGTGREFEHQETLGHFAWIFGRGLLNELMLFRHYYFKGETDLLFWLLAVVQFAWLGWVYIRYLHNKVQLQLLTPGTYSFTFLVVALAYLLFLTGLRFAMPFDSFDYRMLAPATFLVYLALLLGLVTTANQSKTRHARLHIAFMLLLALLLNVLKPSFLTSLYLQFV